MWLNFKVITKKWQPPPPPISASNTLPLSGLSPFLAKIFVPLHVTQFLEGPTPLPFNKWGGGGGPTMLVVKCLGNFTFKIQIHFWNSLSNTCLVNMRRFSLPKFSDFLWWNFTSIYRPDVFYLSSSLSLKISKKDCLTN